MDEHGGSQTPQFCSNMNISSHQRDGGQRGKKRNRKRHRKYRYQTHSKQLLRVPLAPHLSNEELI